MIQTSIPVSSQMWVSIKDGEPGLREIYETHYSARRYKDGRRPAKIVGPGEYILLASPLRDALFVWRKFRSMDYSHGTGVNCSVFRNEGPRLSSSLIREAVEIAWQRWPGQRLYTYVNPGKVRSTNPGCCFLKAGWKRAGRTKGGLLVFEIYP